MATPAEKAALLRAFNDSLLDDDPELVDAEGATNERLEVNRPPQGQIDQESIIMRRRRPVLAIQNGATVLEFKDTGDIPLWKTRLESAAGVLGRAIASVGRIELTGNPDFSWVGTGWLVHPRFLVTNRHVAEEFARSDGDGFVFQAGPDGDMAASIDMLQEIGRDDKQVFAVKGVSYIEPRPGLDLAFLEVEQIDGKVATPIALSARPPATGPFVATIGYPAFDSRIPEPDLDEADLWRGVRQEASRAWGDHRGRRGARAPQLHDARRELRIGRARSEDAARRSGCTSAAASCARISPFERIASRSGSTRCLPARSAGGGKCRPARARRAVPRR